MVRERRQRTHAVRSPERLGSGSHVTNLGCPGETSRTLRVGGICPYPGGGSQLDTALGALDETLTDLSARLA